MSDIYKMKLHEEISIKDRWILRVPGGWIYTVNRYGEISSVFVRFDNEFFKPTQD